MSYLNKIKLSNKKIFVIGGSGLIGIHIVKNLTFKIAIDASMKLNKLSKLKKKLWKKLIIQASIIF